MAEQKYLQFAGQFISKPVATDKHNPPVGWRVVITVKTETASARIKNCPPRPDAADPDPWNTLIADKWNDLRAVAPELHTWLQTEQSPAVVPLPDDIVFQAPLTFDDDPLTIEWNQSDKLSVIQGAQATLKIVSPGDRTYDLFYTDTPGQIRVDIYRNNTDDPHAANFQLFWSGTLDPEQYEEPYESAAGYVVALQFTDLGLLDRLDFTLKTPVVTLDELLEEARRAAFIAAPLRYMVSTTIPTGAAPAGQRHPLYGLQIRTANFYDEEGDPCSWKEAVEGILQPLALKMVQRQGQTVIYDLNALHVNGGNVEQIEWSADRQTLSVDKVYNRCIVTFSPYGSGVLSDGKVKYNIPSAETAIPLAFNRYEDDPYHNEHAIDILYGGTLDGVNMEQTKAAPFRILKQLGGTDDTVGVMVLGNGQNFIPGAAVEIPAGTSTIIPRRIILTSKRVYLPPLPVEAARNYFVRIVQPLFLDCRYNPFNGAYAFSEDDNDDEDGNYEKNQKAAQNDAHYVFIPVRVQLFDTETATRARQYFDNQWRAFWRSPGRIVWRSSDWAVLPPGIENPAPDRAYFEYYDKTRLGMTDNNLGGWHTNRHTLGRVSNRKVIVNDNGTIYPARTRTVYPPQMALIGDGEYISYPPGGGWLEVQILPGVRVFNGSNSNNFSSYHTAGLQWGGLQNLRWMLYKAPEIDIVNASGDYDSTDVDDIEITGWVDRAAKEELKIDTITGSLPSMKRGGITARGALLVAATGMPVEKLTRAGVTDSPEKLLIGTVITHHDGRRNVLDGEARTPADWPRLFTDPAQPAGTYFAVSSETLHAIDGVSDIRLVETRPDTYHDIEAVTD